MMHIENILQVKAWKILTQPTNLELNISQQPFNFQKKNIKDNPCANFLQTECIDLSKKNRENVPEIFAKSVLSRDTNTAIDSDGLPRLGQVVICSFYIKSYFLVQEQLLNSFYMYFHGQTVHPNEQYYSVYNRLTGAIRPVKLKGSEPAYIDYVAVNGTSSKGDFQKVCEHISNPVEFQLAERYQNDHTQVVDLPSSLKSQTILTFYVSLNLKIAFCAKSVGNVYF